MTAPPPVQTVNCTQCGGELHPDEGQSFLTCPFCKSTVYIDKSRVVFHWYLAPTLDEAKARSALARWMAGSQTVKDLDRKARLLGVTFEYFPLWYFKTRAEGGREQVRLQMAAASSVSELKQLKLPPGDLRKYDPALDAQAQAPSVPLEAASKWLVEIAGGQEQIIEQALVHIPLYTFKYNYQNRTYTALVDGAAGGVFANLFPAKAEAPFMVIGSLTALIFLCLATFPIIGVLSNGLDGLGLGMGLCLGLGLLAAPILLAVATWIAAKV
jgi:predicted RNA-binding Zn-ribbon protein involved in translation (DUF1610 family)